jgi:hypothetical protein
MDVIEKVEGPTSSVNPLVVVLKPSGNVEWTDDTVCVYI